MFRLARRALLEALSAARESQIPAKVLNLLNGLSPFYQKWPHPALLVPGRQCVFVGGKCPNDTITRHNDKFPLVRKQFRQFSLECFQFCLKCHRLLRDLASHGWRFCSEQRSREMTPRQCFVSQGMAGKTRKICLFRGVFNVSNGLGDNIPIFAAKPIPPTSENLHKPPENCNFFFKKVLQLLYVGLHCRLTPSKWGWWPELIICRSVAFTGGPIDF